MNTNIFTICGDSGPMPDFEKIKSDPNFIFEADPNFSPITLFNESGTAITVNSWLECANYVNGGWVNNIVKISNYEELLFYGLLGTSLLLIVSNIYKKQRRIKF
tara:strand:+ start:926 stop:1237 length:312 start_codon:yes stop_codon:yes gene_type:complete